MIPKVSVIEKDSLTPKVIIQLDTPLGYMHVLEYTLQDCSYLHVVQWHFNNIVEGHTLCPKNNVATFFRNRDSAMSHADGIGTELLKCF